MALTIMTNVASLNAQRNLNKSGNALAQNLGRLSSGLRINRAGDDAAGLAISENLKAQIRSMSQAERNANDGISLLQTAEGGMNEVSGILTRMRELGMQAATDTLGSTERGFADQEFQALSSEIDRISAVTEFNGTALLDGTASAVDFQVGFRNTANDRITVAIAAMDTTTLGVNASDVTTKANARTALDSIDAAITLVSGGRADLGAYQNRLQVTTANLASSRENISAANSRIRDVDVAEESAAMTRNNILQQAGVSILAQANQSPKLALSLLR